MRRGFSLTLLINNCQYLHDSESFDKFVLYPAGSSAELIYWSGSELKVNSSILVGISKLTQFSTQ